MGGGDEGGGEGKETMMQLQRLVVCRLLAPGGQVGCVLGKGGKIVEKIRLESGAQIRVFGKEHLPLCAAPSDELIQVSFSFSIYSMSSFMLIHATNLRMLLFGRY